MRGRRGADQAGWSGLLSQGLVVEWCWCHASVMMVSCSIGVAELLLLIGLSGQVSPLPR